MEDILGFNGTKEEVLNIWAKNAENWLSSGSPWRPSAGDIEIYKNLCGSKTSGKVLILGSTSELRDFVAPENNSPIVVDISPAMLQKMSLLLKKANPADEIWIKSDWCEAILPENYFDLIIGDMVWWVVSIDYQLKLRDKITSLLKQDGLFVSRFRMRCPERRNHDWRMVIGCYLKKLDENPENKDLIKGSLTSYLWDITVDVANQRINREETKMLLAQTAKDLTNDRHRQFLREASKYLVNADWTSQTREEIMLILEEKFTTVAEARAKDYESEYYPILSFIKKLV